jgi:hypothetical protein
MPSDAFTQRLLKVLQDADELLDAQRQLLSGRRRQWGIGSLNRAVVVMCIAAWEGYVEQVVQDAVEAVRPAAGAPQEMWELLKASAGRATARFHTPNASNVKELLHHSLGLPDVTSAWHWRKCSARRAVQLLNKALEFRHKIAHGVHARPRIPTRYATELISLFRRLGNLTDASISAFLVSTFRIAPPW